MKGLVKPVVVAGLNALGAFEAATVGDAPPRWPPTFLLGPPRSGSTFLGQLVTWALDVAYFPNFVFGFRTPGVTRPPVATATRVAKWTGALARRSAEFQSDYGLSKESGGSADTDPLWKRVLPAGFVGADALDARARRTTLQMVAATERVFGKPFLDKSVGHSLRIPALASVFPDALFLRCDRDPLAVAQSVWFGKHRNETTRTKWITPQVRGFEQLRAEPILEIACRQQQLFDADIDAGLDAVDPARHLTLRYEQVCADPRGELERVRAFMSGHGVELGPGRQPPASYPNRNSRRLERDVYDAMLARLEELYGRPMTPLAEPD